MSMSIFDSLVNAGEFVEQSLAPEKRSNGSLLAGLDFSKILNLRLTQKDPESIPEIGNPNETLLNPPAEARTHSLEAPLPVYRSNLRNLSELEGVLSELIRDVANMIQSGQEIEGEQGEESRSGVDTSKLFDGNESATVFPEVAVIIDPSWQSYAVSPASTEKLVSLLVKLVDRGGKNETSTGTVPPNKIETTEWSYPILSEASGYGDNSEPAASWHGSGFPKMDLFAGAVSVKDDISLTVWTNIARNEKIAGSGPSVKTPENSDQIVNYASAFEADQHDVPAGNADRAVGSTGESRLAVPFREGIWIEITSANADRTPPSSSGLIDGRSRDQNYVHADESPSIPIGKPTDGRAEMRAMNAGQSVIEKSSDEPVPLQILERSNYRRLTIPIQPNGPLSDAYSLDRGNSRIISVFVPRQTQCSDSTSGETGSTSGTGEKTPLPSGSSTTTAGFARESGQVAELASGTL